jgi:hypothetical protein
VDPNEVYCKLDMASSHSNKSYESYFNNSSSQLNPGASHLGLDYPKKGTEKHIGRKSVNIKKNDLETPLLDKVVEQK